MVSTAGNPSEQLPVVPFVEVLVNPHQPGKRHAVTIAKKLEVGREGGSEGGGDDDGEEEGEEEEGGAGILLSICGGGLAMSCH